MILLAFNVAVLDESTRRTRLETSAPSCNAAAVGTAAVGRMQIVHALFFQNSVVAGTVDMVQGNWERRIELTNARRAAAKLEKANRRQRQVRPRSNSTTKVDTTTIERSVLRLEEWLVRFGQVWNGVDGEETAATEVVKQQYDGNADDYGLFVVDIWTDVCPMSRGLEYELHVDNYFVHGKKADDKDIIVIDHDDGSKHDGKERNLQRKVKVGHIQIPRVK